MHGNDVPSHGEHFEGLMMTVILYLKLLFTTPHVFCLLASLGCLGKRMYKIQLEVDPDELLHI